MKKMLRWSWWNEKVIEVPEHYHDWMAPRWYIVVVAFVYLILISGVVFTFVGGVCW